MFNKIKGIFGSAHAPASANMPAGKIEFIIAGLGNPGREYELTRHNTGFMAMDYIAEKLGVRIDRIKFKSLTSDAVIAGNRVLLLKPQTYMNNSGEAVRDAAAFYKIPMDHIIIIYDDVSMPVGKLRIRPKGTDGGHNGIKNIIYLSGTDVFPRIKIGVGQKPHPDYDLAKWVLGKYSKQELELINQTVEKAYSAVQDIIKGDIGGAMNKYNG